MRSGVAMLHGAPRRLLGACLLLMAGLAAAQDYGDTPYVQTPMNVVEQMLRLARVGPKDYLIDLGSGDGRIVIMAAKKFGARGFGVDLDKRLVELGNRTAVKEGLAGRAEFFERDLYDTDLTPATVVSFYLLPEVNIMMRPRLLSLLKPGTRLVSHDYDLGEWQPDRSMVVPAPDKPVGREKVSKIFYWVVPAKVEGRWQMQLPVGGTARGYEIALSQSFQMIEGVASADGKTAKVAEARLEGDRINLVFQMEADAGTQRVELRGRVSGDVIDGNARIAGTGAPVTVKWSARRVQDGASK